MDTSCDFCAELIDPTYPKRNILPEWQWKDRFLLSSPEWVAIPGYSPQVYPYVLIVAKRHFERLCSATQAERVDLIALLNELRRTPPFIGRQIVLFEHAGCAGKHSAACIDHCHLHVIVDMIGIISAFIHQKQTHAARISRDETLRSAGRYLFAGILQENEIRGFQSEIDVGERQYFRRLIAELVGQDLWNWRIGFNRPYMERLMAAVRGPPD